MSACPLKDGCSLGNCKFCSQKMDCILVAILQKVESLEHVIEETVSQSA